ncbi:hypothetical protein [Pseudonocardia acaciae]|uniref:hypothetical protein n=1 Tax=Pseudonocardia acaciae TaxID=551276 RepID=UPI0009FE486A|nr:hypothetical protein [Pseudonocardia acaciae]
MSVRVRRAEEADAPALARLRRLWTEEDGAQAGEPGFEERFAGQRDVLSPSERSVSFYRRAGFGPATMLMARVLRP